MTITISEQEILSKPNAYELGEYIQRVYWQMKDNVVNGRNIDENIVLHVSESGQVTKIQKPNECSICGKDTSKIDYDYLVGCDHIDCVLGGKAKMDMKDHCVICGKETPYLRSTHIDQRVGYVEGSGQLCLNCYNK